MSLLFKSCSSKSSGDHSLEDEEIIKKGKTLVKWKIPKVPIHKMFEERRGKLLRFTSDPSIRTTESKFSFGKGGFFKLYNEIPSSYGGKGKHYTKMNIGLVQIGVKTLTTKIPSNASIIICLRDNRVPQLHDSLLGLVESKLKDGPFYFNVFPNTNLPLDSSNDLIINNILSVHVFVKGFDEIPKGSDPIVVTCRTCYKLNPNNFGAEALLESPVGKTLFFQTRIHDDDDDVVQKVTIWDKVQLPSDWPHQLEINRPRMSFPQPVLRCKTFSNTVY